MKYLSIILALVCFVLFFLMPTIDGTVVAGLGLWFFILMGLVFDELEKK